MRKPILALIILILATMACGEYVTTTPTVLPASTDTGIVEPTSTFFVITSTPASIEKNDTGNDTATVLVPVVNVRDSNGSVIGYVRAGETVTIVLCDGNTCEISSPVAGFVWRGCLSDNPDGLECRSK